MAEARVVAFCGAIRYSIGAEPTASVCHCRKCQYVSGDAPAYVKVFPKPSFRLTKGTPRAYWSLSERGTRVARCFCESCGTPVFGENEAPPEVIAVKVGGLDNQGIFKPGAHCWTSSAPPWHAIASFLLTIIFCAISQLLTGCGDLPAQVLRLLNLLRRLRTPAHVRRLAASSRIHPLFSAARGFSPSSFPIRLQRMWTAELCFVS